MAKKTLQNLAADYQVDNFGEYVCMTFINGNKRQAVELFYEMSPADRQEFLIDLHDGTFGLTLGNGPWQDNLFSRIIHSLRMLRK